MTSGEADTLGDTHSRMVRYDANNLAETITHEIVSVLQKYNFPGMPQMKFVFDIDKPNAKDTLEAAQAFYNMGGTLDEDELRAILGLSRPQPGHAILAQNMPLNPSTMGSQPTGVPQQGQPGPMPEQGAETAQPPMDGAQGAGA
jgi:phage gp29-like protein